MEITTWKNDSCTNLEYRRNTPTFQFLLITSGLLILFLGPYSNPVSLSNIMPYLLVILISFLSGKIKIDRRTSIFCFFYLSNILLIFLYSIINMRSIIDLAAGLDNLIRVVPLFLIGLHLRGTRILNTVLIITIFVSLLLSFLLFINPDFLRNFFLIWYANPVKALQSVNMRRGIATMASPAGLGYFAILALMFFILEKNGKSLTKQFGKLRLFMITSAFSLGILSISKTFIFSLLSLLLLLVCIRLFYFIKRKEKLLFSSNFWRSFLLSLVVVLVFTALVKMAINALPGFENSWKYLTNMVENPFESTIESRYGQALLGMQELIKAYFPFGVGFISESTFDGVFVGDSGYLLMLFVGGLFSFVLYYFSIVWLGLSNRYLFLLVAVGLMIDLGRPAFWGSRAADLFWILAGLWNNLQKENNYANKTFRSR